MNLLSMIGVPDCAVKGCGKAGLIRVEVEVGHELVWAFLCIECSATSMKSCLENLSQVANEDLHKIPEEES